MTKQYTYHTRDHKQVIPVEGMQVAVVTMGKLDGFGKITRVSPTGRRITVALRPDYSIEFDGRIERGGWSKYRKKHLSFDVDFYMAINEQVAAAVAAQQLINKLSAIKAINNKEGLIAAAAELRALADEMEAQAAKM